MSSGSGHAVHSHSSREQRNGGPKPAMSHLGAIGMHSQAEPMMNVHQVGAPKLDQMGVMDAWSRMTSQYPPAVQSASHAAALDQQQFINQSAAAAAYYHPSVSPYAPYGTMGNETAAGAGWNNTNDMSPYFGYPTSTDYHHAESMGLTPGMYNNGYLAGTFNAPGNFGYASYTATHTAPAVSQDYSGWGHSTPSQELLDRSSLQKNVYGDYYGHDVMGSTASQMSSVSSSLAPVNGTAFADDSRLHMLGTQMNVLSIDSASETIFTQEQPEATTVPVQSDETTKEPECSETIPQLKSPVTNGQPEVTEPSPIKPEEKPEQPITDDIDKTNNNTKSELTEKGSRLSWASCQVNDEASEKSLKEQQEKSDAAFASGNLDLNPLNWMENEVKDWSASPPPPPPPPAADNPLENSFTRKKAELEQSAQVRLQSLIAKSNYNPKVLINVPEEARFFVIKSYSEDDVHRSIKFSIWCSTEYGNKKLDEAYRKQHGAGPIYLFFSVNGSGHFCGMAEMTSVVDFETLTRVWTQDKWKGKFSVKWMYVKDIPNPEFRHIRLENNEHKSVTNSRDTQEVPFLKGKQVLDIMHNYRHETSIFDDFVHYELPEDMRDVPRLDIQTRRDDLPSSKPPFRGPPGKKLSDNNFQRDGGNHHNGHFRDRDHFHRDRDNKDYPKRDLRDRLDGKPGLSNGSRSFGNSGFRSDMRDSRGPRDRDDDRGTYSSFRRSGDRDRDNGRDNRGFRGSSFTGSRDTFQRNESGHNKRFH